MNFNISQAKYADNMDGEKSNIDPFDNGDLLPSYVLAEGLDYEFYNNLKLAKNLKKLFWRDNINIEYIFESILRGESLDTLPKRPVPKPILEKANFFCTYQFTLDLLFENAYKVIKKDPTRFIRSTYERFYTLLEQEPNAIEIDPESQLDLEQSDNDDDNWEKFIYETMTVLKADQPIEIPDNPQAD
ncbi:MAG: hypothetical protein AB8G05_07225 [Oligoflexales bacterium]